MQSFAGTACDQWRPSARFLPLARPCLSALGQMASKSARGHCGARRCSSRLVLMTCSLRMCWPLSRWSLAYSQQTGSCQALAAALGRLESSAERRGADGRHAETRSRAGDARACTQDWSYSCDMRGGAGSLRRGVFGLALKWHHWEYAAFRTGHRPSVFARQTCHTLFAPVLLVCARPLCHLTSVYRNPHQQK